MQETFDMYGVHARLSLLGQQKLPLSVMTLVGSTDSCPNMNHGTVRIDGTQRPTARIGGE